MTIITLDGSLEPKIVEFPVAGESLEAVEESIKQNSPNPGGTYFFTSWNYTTYETGDELFDHEIVLTASISVTRPVWIGPKKPELAEEWERYSKRTLAHELNHTRLFATGLRRMLELKDVRRFKAIEKVTNDLSQEYDKITDQGRAEGARLGFHGTVKDFDAWVSSSCKKIMSER